MEDISIVQAGSEDEARQQVNSELEISVIQGTDGSILEVGNIGALFTSTPVKQNDAKLCDVCGKSFARKNGLEEHKKSVHEGTYRHLCGICGKGFQSKTLCQNHESVHVGNKLYKCGQPGCSKSYTHKKDVIVHLQSVHEKVRHPCETCQKSFSTAANLKIHNKSCVLKERYICTLCNISFSVKGNHTRHVKKQHPEACSDALK